MANDLSTVYDLITCLLSIAYRNIRRSKAPFAWYSFATVFDLMPGGMPDASTNNKAPASTLGDMSRNLFSALLARRVFGRSTSRARATSK